MQAFLASLARELRYLRHNPPELFAATALPLLLLALTAWLFSAGVPRGLPIALVDGDRSPQSRALARGLAAAPGIAVVAQPDDLESGWSLLRRLEAYALVHVPHGTRDTLARGGTATVFGYYNAAWQTPGESAYREIQAVVQALGAELASSEVAQALGPGRVRPPPVEVQRTVLYNAAGSYEQYLGLLVHGAMLHLLLCLCAIAAVGRELRDGTAPAWLEACGDRPLAALLGTPVLHGFITGAALVIATCVDQANVIACQVSETLGLPHPYSYETAATIANKGLMKARLIAHGMPTARFVHVRNADAPDIGELRFPLVVKPADSNGSAGVRRADTPEQLTEYLRLAIGLSRASTPFRSSIMALMISPLVVPVIITGAGKGIGRAARQPQPARHQHQGRGQAAEDQDRSVFAHQARLRPLGRIDRPSGHGYQCKSPSHQEVPACPSALFPTASTCCPASPRPSRSACAP